MLFCRRFGFCVPKTRVLLNGSFDVNTHPICRHFISAPKSFVFGLLINVGSSFVETVFNILQGRIQETITRLMRLKFYMSIFTYRRSVCFCLLQNSGLLTENIETFDKAKITFFALYRLANCRSEDKKDLNIVVKKSVAQSLTSL